MHYSTPADAETWAAIRIALAALGAYADGALIWHVGERHTDDDAGGWGLGVGGFLSWWGRPTLPLRGGVGLGGWGVGRNRACCAMSGWAIC